MNQEKQTAEEFVKNIHQQFPGLENVRRTEIKRRAQAVWGGSRMGQIFSIIYFLVAVISIFIYWVLFDVNIFLSIFLGLITWLAITFIVDKFVIKISGVEQAIFKLSEEEIKDSLEGLKKTGVLK